MTSLEDIIKELEAEGFRLIDAKVNSEGVAIKTFARLDTLRCLTTCTFLSYILPPNIEEEEGEEEEQMVYSQEEMEFIRRELSSRFPLEDVDFWLEKMPDIPLWLQKMVLIRREVIASDKGEQPRSGSA